MLSRDIKDAIETILTFLTKHSDDPCLKNKGITFELALSNFLRHSQTTNEAVKDWFKNQKDLTEFLRKNLNDKIEIIESKPIPLSLDVDDSAKSISPERKSTIETKYIPEIKSSNPADILSTISIEEIKMAEQRLPTHWENEKEIIFWEAVKKGDLPVVCFLVEKVASESVSTAFCDLLKFKSPGEKGVQTALLLLQMKCDIAGASLHNVCMNWKAQKWPLTTTLIEEMRKQRDDLFPSEWHEWAYDGNLEMLQNIKSSINFKKGILDLPRESSSNASSLAGPLEYACAGGHLDAVKLLCHIHRKYNPNLDKSVLDCAVRHDNLPIVKYLVEEEKLSQPRIINAKSLSMVQYLRGNGAELVRYTNSAFSLFDIYDDAPQVWQEFLAIAEYLLQNTNAMPPREMLANYNFLGNIPTLPTEIQKQIVTVFLEHVEDSKAFNFDENAPLHKAAARGNIEIVRLLLEHKANTGSKDQDEYEPIAKAINALNSEYQEKLPSQEKIDNYKEIREMLLKAGASLLCHINNKGNSPLHWAVENSNLNEIRYYLSQNKKLVNVRNKERSLDEENDNFVTPLFLSKNAEITELLLQHGAEPNCLNASNFTALYYAKNIEMVSVLKKFGAIFRFNDLKFGLMSYHVNMSFEVIISLIENLIMNYETYQLTKRNENHNAIYVLLLNQCLLSRLLQKHVQPNTNYYPNAETIMSEIKRFENCTEPHFCLLMKGIVELARNKISDADSYFNQFLQKVGNDPRSLMIFSKIYKTRAVLYGFPIDEVLEKQAKIFWLPSYEKIYLYLNVVLQCSEQFSSAEKVSLYWELIEKINKLLAGESLPTSHSQQLEALNLIKKQSLAQQIEKLKSEPESKDKLKILEDLATLSTAKQKALHSKLKKAQKMAAVEDHKKVAPLEKLLEKMINLMPRDANFSAQQHYDFAFLLRTSISFTIDLAEDALSKPERLTLAISHLEHVLEKTNDDKLIKEAKILKAAILNIFTKTADFQPPPKDFGDCKDVTTLFSSSSQSKSSDNSHFCGLSRSRLSKK